MARKTARKNDVNLNSEKEGITNFLTKSIPFIISKPQQNVMLMISCNLFPERKKFGKCKKKSFHIVQYQ